MVRATRAFTGFMLVCMMNMMVDSKLSQFTSPICQNVFSQWHTLMFANLLTLYTTFSTVQKGKRAKKTDFVSDIENIQDGHDDALIDHSKRFVTNLVKLKRWTKWFLIVVMTKLGSNPALDRSLSSDWTSCCKVCEDNWAVY